MYKLGLVSVTFRQTPYEQVIDYTARAGLSCIEWGGDVHVPFNDAEHAKKVAARTKDAGLTTSSYGSYYRLDEGQDKDFPYILDTAEILGAAAIRVWGGAAGSAKLSEEKRQTIIEDTLNIAAQAKKRGVDIGLEYHRGTITDTLQSSLDFIEKVREGGGENVYLYWQPNQDMSAEANTTDLIKVCSYLSNVHVFAWEGSAKFPLEKHNGIWKEYIKTVSENAGDNRALLLEFVCDGMAEQFYEDAKTLKEIIA